MRNDELVDGEVLERDLPDEIERTKKEVIPEEQANLPDDMLRLGIDANIAMQVFQDRMYSDKHIMFQELPSNGRDAIKRREREHPSFKDKGRIDLTISRDGKFTCRDNGIGISRRVFEEVYRIYGRSDKRNTDREVGMFGLGAKSPFALVDSYFIRTTSMEDDMTYEVMMTKSGLSFLNVVPKDGEDYGTEVVVHIPGYIDAEFQERLQRLCRYWDIPVHLQWLADESEVISQHKVDEDFKRNLRVETEDFVAFPWTRTYSRDDLLYIEGIPYTVSLGIPQSGFQDNGTTIFLKNSHLVRLTATRESIEQDDKFLAFKENFQEQFTERMSELLTEYFDNLDISKAGSEVLNYIQAGRAIGLEHETFSMLRQRYYVAEWSSYRRGPDRRRNQLLDLIRSNTRVFWVKSQAPHDSVVQAREEGNSLSVIYLHGQENPFIENIFPSLTETYPPRPDHSRRTTDKPEFVLYRPGWRNNIRVFSPDNLPDKLPILSSSHTQPNQWYHVTRVCSPKRIKRLKKEGYPILSKSELQAHLLSQTMTDLRGRTITLRTLKRWAENGKTIVTVNDDFELLAPYLPKNQVLLHEDFDSYDLMRFLGIKFQHGMSNFETLPVRVTLENPTIYMLKSLFGNAGETVKVQRMRKRRDNGEKDGDGDTASSG